MKKVYSFYQHYRFTVLYILLVISINTVFGYAHSLAAVFNIGDILVGAVYVFRDLAQREIKHKVFLAMLFAALMSYLFANKQVAVASVVAFSIGETLDWAIYTFTRKPLSQRLLWSSLLSIPIDTVIFLYLVNLVTLLDFSLVVFSKSVGVLLVWLMWRIRSPEDPVIPAPYQSTG